MHYFCTAKLSRGSSDWLERQTVDLEVMGSIPIPGTGYSGQPEKKVCPLFYYLIVFYLIYLSTTENSFLILFSGFLGGGFFVFLKIIIFKKIPIKIPIMKALSFISKDLNELKNKLASLDFQPTLAFVFSDVSFPISEIQEIFNSKNIDLFGATSAGEIVNDRFYEQTISTLVVDIPKDWYKIHIETGLDQWTALGISLGNAAKNSFTNPSVILTAPGFAGGDFILKGLNFQIGGDVKVIGGFAGDDLSFSKARIYSNYKKTDKGLLAVILDADKILIDGRAINGWTTLPMRYIVTEAENNIVYKINERPAIEVFMEVYNISPDHIVDLINNFGPKYPSLIYRYSRPSVMRHPIKADLDSGALIYSAFIPQMSEIAFGVSATREILKETADRMKQVKDKYPEIDAGIMFSCKARHLAFGEHMNDEISQVYSYWNKPMAGLFTYGEIGIAEDGKSDFHNETFNLLIMREK